MGLSRAINKLFLISKLKLLDEIIKIYAVVTSQQVIWNSWLFNIFKIFVFQMQNSHMFSCSDVKAAFCFPVTNSVAAITINLLH